MIYIKMGTEKLYLNLSDSAFRVATAQTSSAQDSSNDFAIKKVTKSTGSIAVRRLSGLANRSTFMKSLLEGSRHPVSQSPSEQNQNKPEYHNAVLRKSKGIEKRRNESVSISPHDKLNRIERADKRIKVESTHQDVNTLKLKNIKDRTLQSSKKVPKTLLHRQRNLSKNSESLRLRLNNCSQSNENYVERNTNTMLRDYRLPSSTPVASLFHGNPVLPEAPQSSVSSVSETVFSEESFKYLNLNSILTAHMKKLGFEKLTLVQLRGIPAILQGRDALIKSQTGSGKTFTYAVPIIHFLMQMEPHVNRHSGILALIVVPTKELALQTYNNFHDLCKACVRVVPGLLIGGEKKKSEKSRLRRGINILIATPGRLIDHINNTECLLLHQVRFFVLDEADRMLEMGYEKAIANVTHALFEAKKYGDEKCLKSKTMSTMLRNNANKRKLLEDVSLDDNDCEKNIVGCPDLSEDDEEERPLEDIDEPDEVSTKNKNEICIINTEKVEESRPKIDVSLSVRPQTIMLSATLTDKVHKLAGFNLDNPVVIATTCEDEKSSCLSSLATDTIATPEHLSHHFVLVPAKLRFVTLAGFLLSKCLYANLRKIIVFMATQDMVDYHTELLTILIGSYGNVPKIEYQLSAIEEEGERLLDSFKNMSKKRKRKEPVLEKPQGISSPLIEFLQLRGNMSLSDVAARGLDLPSVSWIVQYTAPCSVSDYVHRVGRTSRANTQGSALLMLAPSEVTFLQHLHNSKIKPEELKVSNILTAFTVRPPKMDPSFVLPKSMEEGATRLQLQCEQLLLSTPNLKELAKRAYISFVRAYASYPVSVRDVFSFKAMHLGHYAKSFGLRETPSALGASTAFAAQRVRTSKKERNDYMEKKKLCGVIAQKQGAQPSMATMSEFDSGLDELSTLLVRKHSKLLGSQKKKFCNANVAPRSRNKSLKCKNQAA